MVNNKTTKKQGLRLGVHTSIAGGISKSIERAAELNCSTMQIFSHNPRQWRQSHISDEEASRFKELRVEHDINPVFVHASYLINLASKSDDVIEKSINLLSFELENADRIGADHVVLHTGSASGDDDRKARTRAVESLIKSVGDRQFNASLILENTAGEKGDITSSIHTLAEIMDRCHTENIAGICIDTCHAFSAGYDLRSQNGTEELINEIAEHTGIDKLKLIHLNDSRKPLGAGVDRHEHIGKGFIGMEGFINLFSDKRISNIPIVLETPKKTENNDIENLKKVSNLLLKVKSSK